MIGEGIVSLGEKLDANGAGSLIYINQYLRWSASLAIVIFYFGQMIYLAYLLRKMPKRC